MGKIVDRISGAVVGMGCLWLILMSVAWFWLLGHQSEAELKERLKSLATPIAIGAIIIYGVVSPILERRSKNKEEQEKREEDAERQRKLELERKFYRENPERYVTEYCTSCNMQIPAFAQICPYCRTNLRDDR